MSVILVDMLRRRNSAFLRPPVLGLIAAALIVACAPATFDADATPPAATIEFPVLDAAPELIGETWLNTSSSLRLADLRGKVVLLEMWTFGCVNCRNTLPAVKGWHARYATEGLVVIGNHYPEFEYEADLANLRQAVVDLGITYPVLQDNTGDNFFAYRSRYWPTLYLIDKQGRLRYTHIGEGAYTETEQAIQTLLAEPFE